MVVKNPYREPSKKEHIRTVAVILAALVLVIILPILDSHFGRLGVYLFLTPFLLSVSGLLFVLVRWHAQNTAYRCRSCLHEFEISSQKDFISPHGFGRKYLKCPACGRRSWALALSKESFKQ